MIITYNIENAAYLCAKGEDVTFAITKQNEWSLFLFCFYQLKYKTLKDFKKISFRKKKDPLYYFLKLFATISFGYYTISFDYM